jgi:hypothetical protein
MFPVPFMATMPVKKYSGVKGGSSSTDPDICSRPTVHGRFECSNEAELRPVVTSKLKSCTATYLPEHESAANASSVALKDHGFSLMSELAR